MIKIQRFKDSNMYNKYIDIKSRSWIELYLKNLNLFSSIHKMKVLGPQIYIGLLCMM